MKIWKTATPDVRIVQGQQITNRIYRLGCDIGGTFTDFVLVNDETGEIEINKCLTTPKDPYRL